jgi:glucokinase
LRGFALSSRPVIAVDLGGTRIRAAVVQPDGTRIARNERLTPLDEGPAAIVEGCRDAVRRARAAVPSEVNDAIVGIGISSPGPVDPMHGVVVEPPNLGPQFHDVALADALVSSEGLPAFLDRDTNVAALGEHAFGAARGCDDFIYLTVSTGVGGSIFTGGKLLHGPDGLAGELGHVPVSLDGPRCGCGGIGHVEAFAAGVSLAREARALLVADASPFLADRARARADGGDPLATDELSAKDVAEGALAGDPACVRLMDRGRRALAAACVGYVNAFNPHRIVIGGAIAASEGERLLGPIRAAIASEAFEVVARHVTVVPAALGGDVSLAGAHPLVMSRLSQSTPRAQRTTPRPAQPVAVPGGTPA